MKNYDPSMVYNVVDETWWFDLAEVQTEVNLRKKLKKFDPAKVDISEDFFNQLHDKIMSEIEKEEIQPKTAISSWSKIKAQVLTKGIPSLMTIFSLCLSSKTLSSLGSLTKSEIASQDFVSEAVKSPEDFSFLMINNQSQNDFFVDVASRNFDHLTIHEFDDLVSTKKTN